MTVMVFGLDPEEVGASLRLPSGRLTFAVAVAIRLFWIQLLLVASVGLFG